MEKNIYHERGYKDRKDYLNSLAEEYDIDKTIVYALASMLGASEDFDGLISSLEDYAESQGY